MDWILYGFPTEAVEPVVDPDTKPSIKEQVLLLMIEILSITLNSQHYGNFGILLILGNAGFISSAVGARCALAKALDLLSELKHIRDNLVLNLAKA